MSEDIKLYWVYKTSIKQAEIFFETGHFEYGKKASTKFTNEFNKLFNKNGVDFSIDVYKLNFGNKINQLKAIYLSLYYIGGENAKKKYFEIFGKEYKNQDDLQIIETKINFYIDKLRLLPKKQDKKESISFSELITILETSRGISIDLEISVYRFYKIYEIELKKQRNGRH